MTREQLKERVRRLPMQPGVYMHKDKTGKVIYVGKAKLLRKPRVQLLPASRTAERQDAPAGQPYRRLRYHRHGQRVLKRSCSRTR